MNRPKKNRYKKKSPGRSHVETIRRSLGIFFKSMFVALMIVGMGLVYIFIHDVLTQCDFFKADTISVIGGRRLTPAQILKTADIEPGVNLIALNLRTVRKKLLAHPWIAEADVRRILPKRIDIRIKEQEPLAVIDFGRQFLINKEGTIFKEALPSEASGLPVMTGIECSDWKKPEMPGNRVVASVLAVLKMGESPCAAVPNKLIKNVHVDREIGLTIETEGPVRTICLGYGEYQKKYSRLKRILSYVAENEEIDVIDEMDLRDPDHIVARPGGKEILSEKEKKEV